MEPELILIALGILEAGICKFYLLSAGLLLVFISNASQKKKGLMTKLAMLSSGVLFLITITLTLIARTIQ